MMLSSPFWRIVPAIGFQNFLARSAEPICAEASAIRCLASRRPVNSWLARARPVCHHIRRGKCPAHKFGTSA